MRRVPALLSAVALAAMAPGFAQEAGNAAESTGQVEARTEAVSEKLRCVVCKNQSIAESDAPLAKDLQRLVRERIEAGDTNAEATAFIVARYGEFVLLEPRKSWRNVGLWAGPFAVLLIGAGAAALFIRSRGRTPAEIPALSPEEAAELCRLRGNEPR